MSSTSFNTASPFHNHAAIAADLLIAADLALLPAVVATVQAAGQQVKSRFSIDARIGRETELLSALQGNDEASLSILRAGLTDAHPEAEWVEDEHVDGTLPAGEWWVTDPVEGNINHIHGMNDWCVTATLVRDNTPVLTVVYLPITGQTYTAVRGAGAYLDGVRLRPSAKTDLRCALVGTGQGRPGEDEETHRQVGRSITSMLRHALVLHVSVPATLQLIQVAAGRMDVFWQHSQVRAGLLPGALLITEAGGCVTDIAGRAWTPASKDFLAAAPGVHGAAIDALALAA